MGYRSGALWRAVPLRGGGEESRMNGGPPRNGGPDVVGCLLALASGALLWFIVAEVVFGWPF